MKARTVEALVDFVDESSQRRKRELIALRSVTQDKREHEAAAARRAAIVFAYAHWEGFVKDAARAYLAHVSERGVAVRRLAVHFQALAFRAKILSAATAPRRIRPHVEAVTLLTGRRGEKFAVDPGKAIDAESNLNWEVFENVCLCIGLDVNARWAVYGPFMDDLFRQRSAIAHGSMAQVDAKYSEEAIGRVLEFIEWMKIDISNAAATRQYLRH